MGVYPWGRGWKGGGSNDPAPSLVWPHMDGAQCIRCLVCIDCACKTNHTTPRQRFATPGYASRLALAAGIDVGACMAVDARCHHAIAANRSAAECHHFVHARHRTRRRAGSGCAFAALGADDRLGCEPFRSAWGRFGNFLA